MLAGRRHGWGGIRVHEQCAPCLTCEGCCDPLIRFKGASEHSCQRSACLGFKRLRNWCACSSKWRKKSAYTMQVANFLVSEQAGFENVSNVVGGIDAYASVDARTPRY